METLENDNLHPTIAKNVLCQKSVLFVCCNLLYVAIATAALEMLAGDEGVKMCRKPEIMADAAYAIFLQTCDQMTGQFLIDDDVVKKAGITDLDQYANLPGKQLII